MNYFKKNKIGQYFLIPNHARPTIHKRNYFNFDLRPLIIVPTMIAGGLGFLLGGSSVYVYFRYFKYKELINANKEKN